MRFNRKLLDAELKRAIQQRRNYALIGPLVCLLAVSPAYAMTDKDGDGVPDEFEIAEGTDPDNPANFLDSDGDGIPDYVDLDSDGDAVPDYLEYGGNPYLDTDGDGTPVYLDDDDSDPAIVNDDGKVEVTFDPDNNGTAAFQDSVHNHEVDSDGDTVPDSIEISEGTDESSASSFLDTDNDGTPDIYDGDSDNDGVGDLSEDGVYPYFDRDCDGVPAYLDDDDYNPMTGDEDNRVELLFDPDGDGVASFQDSTVTATANGADTDLDGVPDDVEVAQRTDPLDGSSFRDFDGDGIPDYTDPDDDNDTLLDVVEGNGDADGDSTPNRLDLDSDGDGIADEIEGDADTDGDSLPNFVDPTTTLPVDEDADSDGIADVLEGDADPDGDGLPNSQDNDSDGDGIPDSVETNADNDEDLVPNFLDLDSDDDGISDEVEGQIDTDGDGIADYLDLDSDGDGSPDAVEGVVDTDGDGIPAYIDADEVVETQLSTIVRTGLDGGCVLSGGGTRFDPALLLLLAASAFGLRRRSR
jgi:hypothetical protein